MFAFTIVRIILVLLAIVGITLLLPAGVAYACCEYAEVPVFLIPMAAAVLAGVAAVLIGHRRPVVFSAKNVFAIVAFSWIATCLFGSVPLLLSSSIPRPVDAVFESVSGFTTTGATILSDIEGLPRSINLWRCQMHWLGGMGVVALTVALFPLLGVGGFQLIKAETTGPEKGKMTPKIANTAKALWLIYVVLTLLQTAALMIAGMDFIDALSHAFATLGTGGFSTRNASIGSYHSAPIDWICIVFMFLAGVNFSMYFYTVTGKYSDVSFNSELKAYTAIFIIAVIIIALIIMPQYGGTSFRYSAFQVASIMTTTGFATADYTTWMPAAQFVLFTLYFIGGCSGSTAGSIKVIRWVILAKQISNEVRRMLHPHGVFAIRLNGRAGRKDVVFNVAAFLMEYLVIVFITSFVGCCGNLDLLSSFTAALSMVGNVGPAFGKLGPACNYGFLPDFVKWFYSFAMLAGRLELYTMLIFFMPSYWKK
jgi:trk system potassium uptake protein